jgi:hypothetical protein
VIFWTSRLWRWRWHLGDVAHLSREVVGHEIDRVRQIFPGSGHAGHNGLSTQFAVGADFAGHARDLRSEGAELIDHRVDRFLELQNFAAHIDGDFLGEVAIGHGDGDFGDIADLGGQVGGHRIDALGQLFPDARCLFYLGLSAEFALGADFT